MPQPRPIVAPGDKAAATKALRRRAGQWLRSERERAGLTQAALAEKLGLRYYTFIAQVEGGHGRVPSDQYEAWALALGVNPMHFAQVMLAHYDPCVFALLFPSGAVGEHPLEATGGTLKTVEEASKRRTERSADARTGFGQCCNIRRVRCEA